MMLNVRGLSLLEKRVQNYLIKLWGNEYGFGINSSMLRYNSDGNHTCFSAGVQRVYFNSSGILFAEELDLESMVMIILGHCLKNQVN